MNSLFNRNKAKTKAPTTADKGPANRVPVLIFDEGWANIAQGIHKLVDFLNTDMKRPFDYAENMAIYS